MKYTHILVFALAVLLFTPLSASAQSLRTIEELSDFNRINPLQNPEFDRAGKIVNRKIIDRKNRVVGRVQDIIVNRNGTIASIKTDFDRLRLGDDIFLNYREMGIRPVSNAFAIRMDSDEIREFYPQMLAGIETASGDGNETFSVKKLINAPIRAKDGRRIGKVKTVLFGANGGIARGIYAELTYGTLRGDTVAIPFRSVTFKGNGRVKATVDNDFADAMLTIADD